MLSEINTEGTAEMKKPTLHFLLREPTRSRLDDQGCSEWQPVEEDNGEVAQ